MSNSIDTWPIGEQRKWHHDLKHEIVRILRHDKHEEWTSVKELFDQLRNKMWAPKEITLHVLNQTIEDLTQVDPQRVERQGKRGAFEVRGLPSTRKHFDHDHSYGSSHDRNRDGWRSRNQRGWYDWNEPNG